MTCKAGARSRAVTAAGRSWHGVLSACLGQLEPMPAGANLGLVYLSEALAPVADEVVRALRERTGVTSWLGACGAGVLGGPAGRGADGLAVMVMALPAGAFRVLSDAGPGARCVRPAARPCGARTAADPAALLAELAALDARTLVGGLTAAGRSPIQIAGGVMAGGAACLGFRRGSAGVRGARHGRLAAGPEPPGHQRPGRGDPGAGRPAGAGGAHRRAGRPVPPLRAPVRAQPVGGRALELRRWRRDYADAADRGRRRGARLAACWTAGGPGPSCA